MTIKMKCPFCKSANLEYIDSGFVYFYVKCLSCKAQGPGASNEAEAWERWNQAGYYSAADVQAFEYASAGQVVVVETNNTSIKPGDYLKVVPDPADPHKAFVEPTGPEDAYVGVALRSPQNGRVEMHYLNAMFMMVNAALDSNIKIGDRLKVVNGPPSDVPLVTTAVAGEDFSYIAWSAPTKDGKMLAKLI